MAHGEPSTRAGPGPARTRRDGFPGPGILGAMTDTSRAHAEWLDERNPLAWSHERFAPTEPGLVYLDGNSLGRLPLATAERLRRTVADEWGRGLIRSWDEWAGLPERVGDAIGVGLLGARPGETLVADSTTVNLFRLATAALDARPDRPVIVASADDFPTDRFVLDGIAASRGGTVRWFHPDPVDGPSIEDVARAMGPDVGLVVLSLVHYRSAALADAAAIGTVAHGAGALVLWDLSHAAGAVPIDLTAWEADLAVGCTYKYLDGGPGSPAFLWVRSDLQHVLRPPVHGWFGQRDVFAFGPRDDRAPGIRGWLAGTPSVLALSAVDEGVALLREAGIDALRSASIALTGYAVDLYDARLAPLAFRLGTPRDPARRGSHVTIHREDAGKLTARLVDAGVVPDFRPPDAIRLGLAPLTTRFIDVWGAVSRLAGMAR